MGNFKDYSDIELWKEIKVDNYQAFDELINRYWQPLYNNAFKRVASREVCEDLVQDVFLHIWQRREVLEIEFPGPYLQTAIRYKVYSYFSRNQPSKEFIELFENITDTANLADHQLKYKELKSLVRAWIDTLPEKRRKIFRLYIENNLSTKEIAAELHITQKTVQNQLNRSFGSLKNHLSGSFSFLLFF